MPARGVRLGGIVGIVDQCSLVDERSGTTGTEDRRARPRLLIIDDEPGPRASLRLVFSGDFDVRTADSGHAGIEAAREWGPDIVILDIRMPDMIGTEVLKRIRRHDPKVEVIMLTAYQSLETAKEALRYGASEYVTKPFEVNDLRRVIGGCWERLRQQCLEEERVRNLQRLNRDLEMELEDAQAAISAGRLSAGVVHEINTPLSVVSAYADLLQREIGTSDDLDETLLAMAKKRLGVMRRELERCRGMAHRLLDYARADGEGVRPVGVSGVVSDAGELVRAHPAGRGVSIEFDLPPEDFTLTARRHDLTHLLLNLGINAAQSCAESGVIRFDARELAKVEAPLARIEDPTMRWLPSEGFDPARRHVVVAVGDSGCGIPPENLDRLFRSVFTTKAAGHGTGLGLFICTRIIGRYNGAVFVRSRPGDGTRIECYLRDADAPSG